MKIQVRQGCFETNSSSTHSLVVVPKENWEKFQRGEMVCKVADTSLNLRDPEEAWEEFQKEWKKVKSGKRSRMPYVWEPERNENGEVDSAELRVCFEKNFVNEKGWSDYGYYEILTETIESTDGPVVAVSIYGDEY